MRGSTWAVAAAAAVMAVLVAGAPAVPAAPAATPYPGGRWSPPAASYGVHATKNVLVTMSDGVRLAVDVYRPADAAGAPAAGRFPVLLSQTPYSGSIGAVAVAESAGPGDYFVQRGYVYVAADVRGTGRSLGNGGFFSERDALDGAELATWAATLEGADGSVGLHGCSYLGHTQLYTAAVLPAGHPVKAMIPACSGSDPYRTTYMVSGIPTSAWEGAGLLAGSLLGPTVEAYMVPKYLESQAGGDTAYDGEFWGARNHVAHAAAIDDRDIATLLWNGWDDSGFGGLELWAALQNAHFGRPPMHRLGPKAPVTGRYQLVLGDWSHGGGLDEGVQLQWYETWLRGVDTGLPRSTPTPLHAQEQGSGEWSNHARYPFTTSATKLRFGPGTLAAQPAPAAPAALPWAPPETGAELVFETAPAPTATTVAGPGAVRLRASSTATDLQLMVDLYDVAPDGTATHLSHGGVLGSMQRRHPDAGRSWVDADGDPIRPYLALDGEVPIEPGRTYDLDVPLRPVLRRLAAGHRLRLRVVGQEEAATCFQKATEITTDGIGCRARAGVQARLQGAVFTIDLARSWVNLPLLGAPFRAVPATTSPTGPVALPTRW